MLLDDKGRLFGKINVVDFTAILLVVMIVIGVAYKFTIGSSGNTNNGNTYTVYLRVRVQGRNPDDIKLLKVGDRLITGTQEVDSWIKRIELLPYYVTTTDQYGNIYKKPHPLKKDIVVTIRSEVPLDDKLPYLRVANQDAMIGTPNYGIKTRTTILRGRVEDIREEKKPSNK